MTYPNPATEQKKFNNAKTPEGCANAFHRWLKKYAAWRGNAPEYVFVWKTGEQGFAQPGTWEVCAEELPYEWSIRLSLGGSIEDGTRDEPEFDLRGNVNGVYAECYNGFTIDFYQW